MKLIRMVSNAAGWPHSDLGNESDEVLVAKAKLGDEHALTELWRRHSNVAHRILLRMTGNREDAEDALQKAFMKSLVHLKSFDGRSKFSTWLVRIATNTANALHTENACHAAHMGARPGPPSNQTQDLSLDRVFELESENWRLQHLVAELLIKNQQLRAEIEIAVEFLSRQG